MSVEERLQELGVTLPEARPPLAVYRPAVRTGNLVYVSGQVASRDGAVVHPGTLGVDVSVDEGREAARVAVINALAAARGVVRDLDALRVVRLVGYVASAAEFHEQPAVIDGASEFLRDAFGEELGVGSRLALGVASLPARSPVELELILEVS
jgi:enamine deaminase RidA (YjgF/YER057c/UK114 family)